MPEHVGFPRYESFAALNHAYTPLNIEELTNAEWIPAEAGDIKRDRLTGLPVKTDFVRTEMVRTVKKELLAGRADQMLFLHADMDQLKQWNEKSTRIGDEAIKSSVNIVLTALHAAMHAKCTDILQAQLSYNNPGDQQAIQATLQALEAERDTAQSNILVQIVKEVHAGDELTALITGLTEEQKAMFIEASTLLNQRFEIEGHEDLPLGMTFTFFSPGDKMFQDYAKDEGLTDPDRSYIDATVAWMQAPENEDKLPYEFFQLMQTAAEGEVSLGKIQKELESRETTEALSSTRLQEMINKIVETSGGKRISDQLLMTYMQIVTIEAARSLPEEERQVLMENAGIVFPDPMDYADVSHRLVPKVYNSFFRQDPVQLEAAGKRGKKHYEEAGDITRLNRAIPEAYKRVPYDLQDDIVVDTQTGMQIENEEVARLVALDIIEKLTKGEQVIHLLMDSDLLKLINKRYGRKVGGPSIENANARLTQGLEKEALSDDVKQVVYRSEVGADETAAWFLGGTAADAAKIRRVEYQLGWKEAVPVEGDREPLLLLSATAAHVEVDSAMRAELLQQHQELLAAGTDPVEAALIIKQAIQDRAEQKCKKLKQDKDIARLNIEAFNGKKNMGEILDYMALNFGGGRISKELLEVMLKYIGIRAFDSLHKYGIDMADVYHRMNLEGHYMQSPPPNADSIRGLFGDLVVGLEALQDNPEPTPPQTT